MLKAKKANRSIRIPDEKINEYKKLGYSIYTMEGNLLYEHVEPTEKLKKLQEENSDLKAKLEEASEYAENADKEIEKLKHENDNLQSEVADLKAKLEDKNDSPTEVIAPAEGKKKTKQQGKTSE